MLHKLWFSLSLSLNTLSPNNAIYQLQKIAIYCHENAFSSSSVLKSKFVHAENEKAIDDDNKVL